MHSRAVLKVLRTSDANLTESILAHPLGDLWFDFTQSSLSAYFARARGYVYVAETPQYPEIFKVGKTQSSPQIRVQQLSNEAVVFDFRLKASYTTHDRHFLERAIHVALKKAGTSSQKEFFKTDIDVVENLARELSQVELSRLSSQRLLDCVPPDAIFSTTTFPHLH